MLTAAALKEDAAADCAADFEDVTMYHLMDWIDLTHVAFRVERSEEGGIHRIGCSG